MQLVLRVFAPSRHLKIWLRTHQVLRIGKTEWADLALRDDTLLADVHFQLSCNTGSCWLTSLSSPPTFVNGVAVADRELQQGDCIAAGQTQFSIELRPLWSEQRQLLPLKSASG